MCSSSVVCGRMGILAAERDVAHTAGSGLALAVRTLTVAGTDWHRDNEAPDMMAGNLAGTFTGNESTDSPKADMVRTVSSRAACNVWI